MNYFVLHTLMLLRLSLLFCFCLLSLPSAAGESAWYPFSINENKLSAITDFSDLNHPLGNADRLFVRQAHFYTVGPDGKPGSRDDVRIRLFGINLAAAANFPSEEEAPKIARRLRSLGFNAVRLHQLDAVLSDDEEKPQGILTTGAFPSFNPTAINRLRTFIHALKQEGIYVNLNLHVAYRFRYAVDQVTPLTPGETMPFASHPLHLFEPRMITLQAEYAQQLIRRLQLNDDPVLAMVEISNESSLLGAWQRKDLDALKGEYERLLQQQWQHWIIRQYGSLDKACVVWDSCGAVKQGALLVKTDEAQILSVGEGYVARIRHVIKRILRRLNVASPSVIEPDFQLHQKGAGRRVLDFTRFLVEMDRQYFDQLRKTVRTEVGDLVPVTGTQMYFGGVLNADSQRDMDYVDEHFYVDHYDFPHQEWDRNDWRIKDQSVLKAGLQSLLSRAFYRDVNKPFVISEFNQAYPNRQGAEIIPVVSAIASAQDWDGLFFFHYVNGDSWQALPSSFGLSGHTGQLVGTGISAAMFRRFQIQPLSQRLLIPLAADSRQMLGAMRDGVVSHLLEDYLQTKQQVSFRDVFDHQIAMHYLNTSSPAGIQKTGPANPDPEILQADGRMALDMRQGNLRITSTFSALFAGTEARQDQAPPAKLLAPAFSSEGRQYGVILLTSRDLKPLATSTRLLMTVSGATMGTQPDVIPERPKKLIPYGAYGGWWTLEPDSRFSSKPSGSRDARAPVWQEKMNVGLFFPSTLKHLLIYPLDQDGQRLPALPSSDVMRVQGGFQIRIHSPSPWYELVLSSV